MKFGAANKEKEMDIRLYSIGNELKVEGLDLNTEG